MADFLIPNFLAFSSSFSYFLCSFCAPLNANTVLMPVITSSTSEPALAYDLISFDDKDDAIF
jgi:hypothetical protein